MYRFDESLEQVEQIYKEDYGWKVEMMKTNLDQE